MILKLPFSLEDIYYKSNEENKNFCSWDGSLKDIEGLTLGSCSLYFSPAKVSEHFPQLKKLYPKKNIALKMLVKISNAAVITQIQNIYSWYGLAPRIFNLIGIEATDRTILTQVCENVEGEYCYGNIQLKNIHRLMKSIPEAKHIDNPRDFYPSNVMEGKWIDFGGFQFNDFPAYQNEIAIKYNLNTKFSHNGAYQECPELGVKGGRGSIRKDIFELDKFDFDGKTVLDIGCSGGYFVNYCSQRGARAIGVDTEDVAYAAKEAANVNQYFGSEFYGMDLTKDYFLEHLEKLTGLKKYDYVFFCSMDQHIGFKDYLKDIADTLFFESNGGKKPEEEHEIFSKKLKELFPIVEYKGNSKEGAERNLFIAKKI